MFKPSRDRMIRLISRVVQPPDSGVPAEKFDQLTIDQGDCLFLSMRKIIRILANHKTTRYERAYNRELELTSRCHTWIDCIYIKRKITRSIPHPPFYSLSYPFRAKIVDIVRCEYLEPDCLVVKQITGINPLPYPLSSLLVVL